MNILAIMVWHTNLTINKWSFNPSKIPLPSLVLQGQLHPVPVFSENNRLPRNELTIFGVYRKIIEVKNSVCCDIVLLTVTKCDKL